MTLCSGATLTEFFYQDFRATTIECAAYFSTVIESTWIVLVLAFRVPTTLTFFATNFSEARWSLSV
jgi:hypothetical protein